MRITNLESLPKVIIACDFQTRQELDDFLTQFPQREKLFLKLGMELIYGIGFEVIKELKTKGHAIFLDLKLHDIPVTMLKAIHSLNQYEVDFLTIHLASGQESLTILSKATENLSMSLLGVSVLTSLDSQDVQTLFQNPDLTSQNLATNLAGLAVKNQLFGIICSPNEARIIKSKYPSLKLVTPGIQLTSELLTDQKRVATPQQAKEWGSDYLVVGRMITKSKNPYLIYQQIRHDFGDLNERKTVTCTN